MDRKYTVAKQDVAWRRVDDEVLVLHLRTGYYYSLNETGARLWEELAAGTGFSSACAVLAREFAVEADAARADAEAVLAELCRENLLCPA